MGGAVEKFRSCKISVVANRSSKDVNLFSWGGEKGGTGEERNLGTRFSTQTPREIPYSHLKITRRGGKKGTKTIKRFIQKLSKSGMFFFYLSPSLSRPYPFLLFLRDSFANKREI